MNIRGRLDRLERTAGKLAKLPKPPCPTCGADTPAVLDYAGLVNDANDPAQSPSHREEARLLADLLNRYGPCPACRGLNFDALTDDELVKLTQLDPE